jgi:hypothetical protein
VLLFVLAECRLAYTMSRVFLLLSMDGRDICGWMISRRVGYSGLLAVSDEVLQVLYGTHVSA